MYSLYFEGSMCKIIATQKYGKDVFYDYYCYYFSIRLNLINHNNNLF